MPDLVVEALKGIGWIAVAYIAQLAFVRARTVWIARNHGFLVVTWSWPVIEERGPVTRASLGDVSAPWEQASLRADLTTRDGRVAQVLRIRITEYRFQASPLDRVTVPPVNGLGGDATVRLLEADLDSRPLTITDKGVIEGYAGDTVKEQPLGRAFVVSETELTTLYVDVTSTRCGLVEFGILIDYLVDGTQYTSRIGTKKAPLQVLGGDPDQWWGWAWKEDSREPILVQIEPQPRDAPIQAARWRRIFIEAFRGYQPWAAAPNFDTVARAELSGVVAASGVERAGEALQELGVVGPTWRALDTILMQLDGRRES
jgi:hypothetical protein